MLYTRKQLLGAGSRIISARALPIMQPVPRAAAGCSDDGRRSVPNRKSYNLGCDEGWQFFLSLACCF